MAATDPKSRPGWTWVAVGSGGFWTKQTGPAHTHKIPFFCPYETCRRPTGTVDDPYLEKYGICYLCYTMYVDARETPAIDLSKYKPNK